MMGTTVYLQHDLWRRIKTYLFSATRQQPQIERSTCFGELFFVFSSRYSLTGIAAKEQKGKIIRPDTPLLASAPDWVIEKRSEIGQPDSLKALFSLQFWTDVNRQINKIGRFQPIHQPRNRLVQRSFHLVFWGLSPCGENRKGFFLSFVLHHIPAFFVV